MFELDTFVRSTTLLVVLLNPFLMSIYLLDLIEQLDDQTFARTLTRGASIAAVVFGLFAIFGDAIFQSLLQVRFASFLIFGGLLFLVIGLRFAQVGPEALRQLRGRPEHLAGSVAMPFMIGPGTVCASVLAGARLPLVWALGSIALGMVITVAGLLLLKGIHSHAKRQHAALVDRYFDIVGRASALLIGTIAVDMMLTGYELWRTAAN